MISLIFGGNGSSQLWGLETAVAQQCGRVEVESARVRRGGRWWVRVREPNGSPRPHRRNATKVPNFWCTLLDH